VKERGLQKQWVKIASTCVVLVIMIATFIFSGQGQEQSEGLSFPIGDAAMSTGFFEFELFDGIREAYEANGEPMWLFVQRLIRKLAHVAIFLALGFGLRICMESWLGKKKLLWLWATIIGILYAVSDEVHQMMVPGRSGSLEDVLLDSAGVLAGVGIAAWTAWLVRKKARQNSD